MINMYLYNTTNGDVRATCMYLISLPSSNDVIFFLPKIMHVFLFLPKTMMSIIILPK